jgi:hypothetical protein
MCTTCGCAHSELKADAMRWRQLSYVGVQLVEADETGPEERYEVRNAACGSTLLLQITGAA